MEVLDSKEKQECSKHLVVLIHLFMNIQFYATLYYVAGETVCRGNLHSVIIHTFKWLVITNLCFDSLSQ